jgi:hypothetical protein
LGVRGARTVLPRASSERPADVPQRRMTTVFVLVQSPDGARDGGRTGSMREGRTRRLWRPGAIPTGTARRKIIGRSGRRHESDDKLVQGVAVPAGLVGQSDKLSTVRFGVDITLAPVRMPSMLCSSQVLGAQSVHPPLCLRWKLARCTPSPCERCASRGRSRCAGPRGALSVVLRRPRRNVSRCAVGAGSVVVVALGTG